MNLKNKINLSRTVAGLLVLLFFSLVFVVSCSQEKMLFRPDILASDYKFTFQQKFNEKMIEVEKNVFLHGLYFKADTSKGVVLYLHGNAGCNAGWGKIADLYLKNKFDLFILDYRGFGKSTGAITSERLLLGDIQVVYDTLKNYYSEKQIVVIGYSIGTGLAAYVASANSPAALILKAPYYNMPDLVKSLFKIVPGAFVRYKLKTNEYIKNVKCPVYLFHGTLDETIYYESSLKLQKLLKPGDTLITLDGQKHNGMNKNEKYREELGKILSKVKE